MPNRCYRYVKKNPLNASICPTPSGQERNGNGNLTIKTCENDEKLGVFPRILLFFGEYLRKFPGGTSNKDSSVSNKTPDGQKLNIINISGIPIPPRRRGSVKVGSLFFP